jgi:hypothetical protein
MSELLKISLPDGSVREVERGTTPADIAAAIGPGLAKAALAARVNGELRDLGRPFEGDAELALVTSRDEADALELARHDFAHVLAEAVQALWPGTQITFGPATEDGFYYDVKAPDSREPFSLDDLPAIEEKMREIIRADKPLRREVWSRERLIEKWRAEQPPGPRGMMLMIGRRLTMRGFIVTDHPDASEEYISKAIGWIADGKLVYRETIAVGIENAAQAFIDMLQGGNTGKQIVRLS